MKRRLAEVQRKTTETQVKVRLDLDGTGQSRIHTTMPFLDHMLTLMAKHGRLDLTVVARGDTEVDFHHTVEDIGIVLGETVAKALRDKQGIKRYGSFSVPMDEAIARVDLDLSGRPYLIYQIPLPKKKMIRDFDVELIEEFFKAFGRALDQAAQMDARTRGVPSTKGKL